MSFRVLKCASSKLASVSSCAGKKVAVVLSGCGVYDGSEITESVSTLIHLSAAGVEVQCYAPDEKQFHAVNHLDGSEHTSSRNVLQESARIARGNVQPLSELKASDFSALIVPGGFGAAKNLCNHAHTAQGDASKMIVNAELARCLNEFADGGKPIGLCCISPVIAAAILGNRGVAVTVGKGEEAAEGSSAWPYAGTSVAIQNYGAEHVDVDFDEVLVDNAHKVVTAPAYMHEGSPSTVYLSVGGMVKETLNLM